MNLIFCIVFIVLAVMMATFATMLAVYIWCELRKHRTITNSAQAKKPHQEIKEIQANIAWVAKQHQALMDELSRQNYLDGRR